VVRKTTAGNYVLKNEKGELLHRDYVPSELKVVEIDETIFEDEVYEGEEIRDHRGNPSNREYLARWAGYGDRANTWEPASSFSNLHITLAGYWKKIKERQASENKEKTQSSKAVKEISQKRVGRPSLKRKQVDTPTSIRRSTRQRKNTKN
jgi:hypothetical protein